MNTIKGKVVLQETGVGIPEILIIVYALAYQKQPPNELLQTDSTPMIADILQKIPGSSLGSVLTDANGHFELTYEDDAWERPISMKSPGTRPKLALFVMAPEIPNADNGGRVLHSCYPRANAGRIETYLIKLPGEPLRQAGVTIPGARAPWLFAPKADDLLAKMHALAEHAKKAPAKKQSFVMRYKTQQRRLAKTRKQLNQAQRPPQSFDLGLAVQFIGQQGLPEDATLSFDKEAGGLLCKVDAAAAPVALAFAGVKYLTGVDAKIATAHGICLLVDPAKKNFQLCLPRAPGKLAAPESTPSALYGWHQNQLQASDIVKLTSASPESPLPKEENNHG